MAGGARDSQEPLVSAWDIPGLIIGLGVCVAFWLLLGKWHP
jgi:hypothetical protein